MSLYKGTTKIAGNSAVHSHSNKTVIDKFSEVSGAPYYNGSPIGGGTSDYPDLTNKPSINGHTLSGNQTGADLGLAGSSDLDDWAATSTVSSGTVSFSGIDDSGNYAYKIFADVTASSTNKNPSAQISTLSGTGTSSMSVTYTTDADDGTTVKLRRIK